MCFLKHLLHKFVAGNERSASCLSLCCLLKAINPEDRSWKWLKYLQRLSLLWQQFVPVKQEVKILKLCSRSVLVIMRCVRSQMLDLNPFTERRERERERKRVQSLVLTDCLRRDQTQPVVTQLRCSLARQMSRRFGLFVSLDVVGDTVSECFTVCYFLSCADLKFLGLHSNRNPSQQKRPPMRRYLRLFVP